MTWSNSMFWFYFFHKFWLTLLMPSFIEPLAAFKFHHTLSPGYIYWPVHSVVSPGFRIHSAAYGRERVQLNTHEFLCASSLHLGAYYMLNKRYRLIAEHSSLTEDMIHKDILCYISLPKIKAAMPQNQTLSISQATVKNFFLKCRRYRMEAEQWPADCAPDSTPHWDLVASCHPS